MKTTTRPMTEATARRANICARCEGNGYVYKDGAGYKWTCPCCGGTGRYVTISNNSLTKKLTT